MKPLNKQLDDITKSLGQDIEKSFRSKQFLEPLGRFILDQIIKRRTRLVGPHDGTGERSKPRASDSYIAFLKRYSRDIKKARGAKVPKTSLDILVTGQLFNSLKVVVDNGNILIEVANSRRSGYLGGTASATNREVAGYLADRGIFFIPLTPNDIAILQKEVSRLARQVKFS